MCTPPVGTPLLSALSVLSAYAAPSGSLPYESPCGVLRPGTRVGLRISAGILGGVVVRVGDRIYDGSVRRKLAVLRRKMLVGE